MADAMEYTLRIDNLSLQADKFQLKEAFRPFGEVGDVYIPRDRAFALVPFPNEWEAEAAQQQMDGVDICGRSARVTFARDDDEETWAKRRAEGPVDEQGGQGGPPPKRSRGFAGPHIFKALASEHVCSALIGKGGATLRELQEETSARVDFSGRGCYYPDTKCRVLTIRAASSEAVARVLDAVVDHVQEAATNLDDEPSKGRFPGDCRVVALVARYVAGSLLGKGGEDMRRLQAELQCYIEVEKASLVEGHQRVEIRGDADEVKRALRVVNDKVEAEVHRDWFPGWAAQDPVAGVAPAPGFGRADGRGAQDGGRGRGRGHAPAGDDQEGPSAEELSEFQGRYPVDERAWQYFTSSSGAIQAKVVQDFRPKPLRNADEDFSALLTSFVASVAKRFSDNPAGFRKGLSGGQPEDPRGQRAHRSSPSRAKPRAPALPPPVTEQDVDRDASGLRNVLAEIPLRYLGFDYALCCDLPADRCKPVKQSLAEVGRITNTQIEFLAAEAEGTLRLHVTGRLPDVYAAHLRLMWAFNEGEDKPAEPDEDLHVMQNQIAELQAQLDAVKQGAQKWGGGQRGKGKNGKR